MKINFEKIILVIFVGLMLYTFCYVRLDQRISHDLPVGYGASDAFQHQTRTEGLKDNGNYRFEVRYLVAGLKDVVGYYPPIFNHISAIFSYASGLESYDATYMVVVILTILSSLVIYLLIARLDKNVAMLSLPLMLVIFTGKFSTLVTWGQWAFLTGNFFLICSVLAITYLKLDKAHILLGIFLSAVVLAHTSEFIFLGMFIIFYLLLILFMKKLTIGDAKKLFFAGMILVILSAYYIIIFTGTFMKTIPYQFKVLPSTTAYKNIHLLEDFKWSLPMILIGLVISIVMIFFNKNSEPVIFFGIFMLLIGYTNYVGFEIRAFQTRFMWPIYLAIFFGLTIQPVLHFFIKKKTWVYALVSVLIMMIIIIGIPPLKIKGFYTPENYNFLDKNHWDAMKWISASTDEESQIFFFNSGLFHGQTSLDYNTKRINYLVSYSELIRDAEKGIISKKYSSWIPFDGGASLPYRKSIFSFGFYMKERNFTFFDDVCSYDYYVFDMVGTEEKLLNYDVLVAKRFVKNNMSVAFNNNAVIILKNNNKGGDCIAE